MSEVVLPKRSGPTVLCQRQEVALPVDLSEIPYPVDHINIVSLPKAMEAGRIDTIDNGDILSFETPDYSCLIWYPDGSMLFFICDPAGRSQAAYNFGKELTLGFYRYFRNPRVFSGNAGVEHLVLQDWIKRQDKKGAGSATALAVHINLDQTVCAVSVGDLTFFAQTVDSPTGENLLTEEEDMYERKGEKQKNGARTPFRLGTGEAKVACLQMRMHDLIPGAWMIIGSDVIRQYMERSGWGVENIFHYAENPLRLALICRKFDDVSLFSVKLTELHRHWS